MKPFLSPIAAAAAAIILLWSAPRSSAGDPPAFLQVGKTYSLASVENPVYADERRFKVVEIGTGGWVKVVMQANNQVAWINTNMVPIISPYPPEQAP
jgi:hypothetical protein